MGLTVGADADADADDTRRRLLRAAADLLIGALRVHGRRPLGDLVARFPSRSVVDLLLQTGAALRRRQEPDGFLAVEALIAARQHGEVATALRDYIRERADSLAALVRDGQTRGARTGRPRARRPAAQRPTTRNAGLGNPSPAATWSTPTAL